MPKFCPIRVLHIAAVLGRVEVWYQWGVVMLGNLRAQDSWAEMETGGGVSGGLMLATPFGMRTAKGLRAGDTLRSTAGGPVSIVAIAPAPQQGWMRIPPLALGNRLAVVVGQGQGLLIESSFAQRMVGSAAVVVPALALRNWRGIAQCPAPEMCLRLTLSRPALIVGSTGVLLAANGPANDCGAGVCAVGKLPPQLPPQLPHQLPPVPCLSFGSAQQLIACIIAYEAVASLRGLRPYAAVI